jgi:hypothetical protein
MAGTEFPPPPLLAPGDYHHPVPKGDSVPAVSFFLLFFVLFCFFFRKYFNSTKNQICIKFTKKL